MSRRTTSFRASSPLGRPRRPFFLTTALSGTTSETAHASAPRPAQCPPSPHICGFVISPVRKLAVGSAFASNFAPSTLFYVQNSLKQKIFVLHVGSALPPMAPLLASLHVSVISGVLCIGVCWQRFDAVGSCWAYTRPCVRVTL